MTFNDHNDLSFDLYNDFHDCHGQGHIQRKIFRPFRIRHKKWGFPLKKTNLTSFDFQGHGQAHGKGHHGISREKSLVLYIYINTTIVLDILLYQDFRITLYIPPELTTISLIYTHFYLN